MLLNDLAPGVAMAVGIWAWAMKWWAGADAIVLAAQALLGDGAFALRLSRDSDPLAKLANAYSN